MSTDYSKVKTYLLEAITDEDGNPFDNEKQAFEHVYKRFKSEHDYPNNRKRIPNTQDLLADWLQGLALNIAYTHSDIITLAVSWGGLSVNSTPKQEDAIIENYWRFMAGNLMKFVRRAGVNFNW